MVGVANYVWEWSQLCVVGGVNYACGVGTYIFESIGR